MIQSVLEQPRPGATTSTRKRIGWLLGGLLLLTSCATQPTTQQGALSAPQKAVSSPSVSAASSRSVAASPSSLPTVSPAASSASPSSADTRMVRVTIYKSDDQCVNFVPQQVSVPENNAIEAAVGKVLGIEGDGAGDFDLGGYRVTVDKKSGEATVDLRMNPASRRQIVSLSACEQFALFGSLRQTLTKNPQWKIQSVKFTERGKNIVL